MMSEKQPFWRNLFRSKRQLDETLAAETPVAVNAIDLEMAPDDPLLAYFSQASGAVQIASLQLDSPALRQLQEAGVQLAVPLVSQGELIGLINLGARLSEQEYSSDDRKLLNDLAAQAAPAVRVAQLVRQQQLEAAERERIQQELRVARLIQQTLLPQSLPQLAGWGVTAYYQPARAVGGDFYDFLYFPDGRVGFVIGDVTDKGVPAALVMATTRSMLRAAAERLIAPGAVLERVNDVLHKEIPPKMFVTCLYAVLDPATGHLCYANAGHDLPYCCTAAGVTELRARGMPLGLMPGMQYEEKETVLQPGDTLLLYSDGLVEAHAPDREMFGFPRLQALLADHPGGEALTGYLLDQLAGFTGPGWEQEDDVTLVTLERAPIQERVAIHLEETFDVPSAPGNERQAMQRVAELVTPIGLVSERLERLKTAVAEATMNAMEHGNRYQADVPVAIAIVADGTTLTVRIADRGSGAPLREATTPDLDAKLQGEQSPRGWCLFLIRNMVDEVRVHDGDGEHVVELIMRLNEGNA
jgi:serine phosphatase RsbU (regulator of sigma subunit)/anti-sigma regulatory factor (Ser/Thr protein kinase)